MKKFPFLFLLFSIFIFVGCSDDDNGPEGPDDSDNKLVVDFEGKLTTANSEFISESEEMPEGSYYFVDTFKDNDNEITFSHMFNDWGSGYSFAAFTYTNKTDNSADNSMTAITKSAKNGNIYLCAFTGDYTPAEFTINNPEVYKINGAWVTNATYAYNAMTTNKISGTTPFKKNSYFKLTATGYKSGSETPTGTANIYLANYASDTDTPVNEWIWFDLSPLKDAVKVTFSMSSSDNGDYGMNTPSYFCMDDITLEEK